MTHSTLENIPDSRFTEATIRKMYQLIDAAKVDLKFQEVVYGVVNKSMRGQWKDYQREIDTVLNWFRTQVDYRRDPANVELLQDWVRTLSIRRGDCDDMVVFMCAAAEVLGAPCRIVTVSTRPDKDPSHVYFQAFVGGRWQGVDAIIKWAQVGWEPTDGVTDKRIWTRKEMGLGGDDDTTGVEGLGMHDPYGWGSDYYNVHSGPDPAWEGGFANQMFKFKPPGVPDTISETFAPGRPGEAVDIDRRIPSKEIAQYADDRVSPRSADPNIPYPTEFPITAFRTPQELDFTAPRSDIPLEFDPNAWTGVPPVWGQDPSFIMPQKTVPEDAQMTDLAGLGRHYPGNGDPHAANRIAQEIAREAKQKKLNKSQVRALIDERVAKHQSEREERNRANAAKIPGHAAKVREIVTQHLTQRGLAGLGAFVPSSNVITSMADMISNLVSSGTIPPTATAINVASQAGIDYLAQQEAAKAKAAQIAAQAAAARAVASQATASVTGPSGGGLPSWAIPVGIAALVGIVAFTMSGTKRNPIDYLLNPRHGFRNRRKRGGVRIVKT